MFQKLIWLALAGAAGTFARYGLGGLVQKITGTTFPLGTLVVNLSGCLAFGLVWSLAEERNLIHSPARTIILIGFLGAFTTFSSFIFETGGLIRDSQWLAAIANMMAQNIAGLAFFFVGLTLGRMI